MSEVEISSTLSQNHLPSRRQRLCGAEQTDHWTKSSKYISSWDNLPNRTRTSEKRYYSLQKFNGKKNNQQSTWPDHIHYKPAFYWPTIRSQWPIITMVTFKKYTA